MTVENTQNKMPPLQMGTATEYPFTFAVLLQDPTEEEALEAIKASVLQADGTEIELEYGTDYTVTLNTDRIGGTLTVNNIRTASDYLTIYRQYEQTQEVDYKDFNSAPAETFEQCFDKLTMLSQQQQEEINRSLKLNVSSTTVNPTLPEPLANNTLIWDSVGSSLKNYDIIGENNQFKAEVNSAIAAGQADIQAQFDAFENMIDTEIEDVREAAEKLSTLDEAVEDAQTSATNAQTSATNAQTSAESATQAAQQTQADIQEIEEIVEELGKKVAFKLFDTKLSDHILTYEETQGWALQGTYVYKEALAGSYYGYPDFYNKCLEEYNEATATETVNGVTVKVHSNGHKFYDIANKTAIDDFFNSIGSAWFYGVDTINERIFLPRDIYLTSYISNGNKTVSVMGNGMTLGMTNGTANFGLWTSTATQFYPNSRVYGQPTGTLSNTSSDGTITVSYGVTSDPTKSGIVGNVNLQNTQNGMYLYICVGNTVNYEGITEVVNQGMEILEQVNQGIKYAADGQWVSEHYQVAWSVDLPTTSPLIYDLSSYLPNDGYCYEVLFGMMVTTSSTSNSYARGRLSTDLMPQNVVICSNRVASNSTLGTVAEGNAILPVGLDRTVSILEVNNNSGKTNVSAYGYRRLGTNV